MSPRGSGRDETPRRHHESAHRTIGDEGGLVVLPTRQVVKVLNPVGSKIFSLLDGKHTRDEIVSAVIEEFDVTAEQARADLEGYLDELRAHGMLEDERDSPRVLGENEAAQHE